jgi:hypothetical protein
VPPWLEGLGKETTTRFLGQVVNTDHVEFIKLLKDHYPITGELLEVISDSVTERVVDILQNAAIRITAKKMEDPSLKIGEHIKEVVAPLVNEVKEEDVSAALRRAEPALTIRAQEVATADTRFKGALKSEIVVESEKVRTETDELAKLRKVLRSKTLDDTASPKDSAAVEQLKQYFGSMYGSESDDMKDDPITVDALENIRHRRRAIESQIDSLVWKSEPTSRQEIVRALGSARYYEILERPPNGGGLKDLPGCCRLESKHEVIKPSAPDFGFHAPPKSPNPVEHPVEHPVIP